GEVEELEDAQGPPLGLDRLAGVHTLVVDDDHLAGLDLSLETRADEIERARLRGEDPVAVLAAAEAERAEAEPVAEADQLVVREGDDRERALKPRHRPRDSLF